MATKISFPTNKLFQLKISLKYIKPMIWRRILVTANLELADLHKIIQTAMGWENYHLHLFLINGKSYSLPTKESFFENEDIDYTGITLEQIFTSEKQKIEYEYDFGDGWEHVIRLEKIIYDNNQKHSVCLAGKRNCPPEDSGGAHAYMDLLETRSDAKIPKNDEDEEMMEWIDADFNPESIDLDAINNKLKTSDYGQVDLF